MQRTGRAAVAAMLVGCLGLPHRVVAIEEGPGLDRGLDLLDALEAVADQLGGRDAALADIRRRIDQRERGQGSCFAVPEHVSAYRGVYR